MPRLALVLAFLALLVPGCRSPSSGPTAPADESGGSAASGGEPALPATGPGLDPSDPSLEVDPQICASDADCMIGTPRDCCTGFCPEHRVAWSRAAWAAYQELCAVVECAAPESLACQPELDVRARPTVACVRERCVLR